MGKINVHKRDWVVVVNLELVLNVGGNICERRKQGI